MEKFGKVNQMFDREEDIVCPLCKSKENIEIADTLESNVYEDSISEYQTWWCDKCKCTFDVERTGKIVEQTFEVTNYEICEENY